MANNINIELPKRLTAKSGAKHALTDEFWAEYVQECMCLSDPCPVCKNKGLYFRKIPIEWTTIKDIYAKVVDLVERGVIKI